MEKKLGPLKALEEILDKKLILNISSEDGGPITKAFVKRISLNTLIFMASSATNESPFDFFPRSKVLVECEDLGIEFVATVSEVNRPHLISVFIPSGLTSEREKRPKAA